MTGDHINYPKRTHSPGKTGLVRFSTFQQSETDDSVPNYQTQ